MPVNLSINTVAMLCKQKLEQTVKIATIWWQVFSHTDCVFWIAQIDTTVGGIATAVTRSMTTDRINHIALNYQLVTVKRETTSSWSEALIQNLNT